MNQSNQTNQKPRTQLKLGPALGCYCNIFEPRAIDENAEPKYSISLVFPKDTADKQLAELKRVIEMVAREKFGPDWKKIKKLHLPIRDGDEDKPEQKEFADSLFVNASSKRKPGLVDRHLVPIMDKEDAYSGCKFYAAVNVFAFDRAGNKGVALGLNNLMMYEKGERIGGGRSAAEDFKEFAEESDDDSSVLD